MVERQFASEASLRTALFHPDLHTGIEPGRRSSISCRLGPCFAGHTCCSFRGGVLDGRPGWIYATLQAIYEWQIVLKTRELAAAAEARPILQGPEDAKRPERDSAEARLYASATEQPTPAVADGTLLLADLRAHVGAQGELAPGRLAGRRLRWAGDCDRCAAVCCGTVTKGNHCRCCLF